MARILVSGATGFIGAPLTLFLKEKGHSVVQLVRPKEKSLPNSIVWDPERKIADRKDFEGFDLVIHLAGEPLAIGRWTKAKKEKILKSRKEGSAFLCHLLSSVAHPPKTVISASAIGFYGDRGEELLTEDLRSGQGFLSEVCAEWEKALAPLATLDVRVVYARFAVVLGPGGMLQKLAPLFKLGAGAIIGSGQQWFSWIDLYDLIAAIEHIAFHSKLEGPVNLASPYAVRQKEFACVLASVLHRKVFLWIPSFFIRLILGKDAAALVLSSQRVSPDKILASNFTFHYSDLRSSLFQALKMAS